MWFTLAAASWILKPNKTVAYLHVNNASLSMSCVTCVGSGSSWPDPARAVHRPHLNPGSACLVLAEQKSSMTAPSSDRRLILQFPGICLPLFFFLG